MPPVTCCPSRNLHTALSLPDHTRSALKQHGSRAHLSAMGELLAFLNSVLLQRPKPTTSTEQVNNEKAGQWSGCTGYLDMIGPPKRRPARNKLKQDRPHAPEVSLGRQAIQLQSSRMEVPCYLQMLHKRLRACPHRIEGQILSSSPGYLAVNHFRVPFPVVFPSLSFRKSLLMLPKEGTKRPGWDTPSSCDITW